MADSTEFRILVKMKPGTAITKLALGARFRFTAEPLFKSIGTGQGRRAIAPATTAFQYVHNAADDAAIIGSFDTAYVRRQVRFGQNRFLRTIPIPSKNESGSHCQSGRINEF
jgi:hypothetical protein